MLIELKSLENMPVGSFEEQVLLGRVNFSVINPDDMRLLGFVVQIRGLFPKYKIVSMKDVVDIDQNGVTIRSADSLVERGEIVRIGEILQHKFVLIGMTAKNLKDQGLGRVSDALIETQSGDILRVYINSLLNSRIFERSRIVKIDKNVLILKDDPESEEGTKSKIKDVLPLAQSAETVR